MRLERVMASLGLRSGFSATMNGTILYEYIFMKPPITVMNQRYWKMVVSRSVMDALNQRFTSLKCSM